MTGSQTETAAPKNRTQLILIVAIALASVGGSYLLFYLTQGSGVWGTTNEGEFVSPPVHLADLTLKTGEGAPLEAGESWWLLVNAGDRCEAACTEALHQLRQLHVLLNKEAPRVTRALVADPGFDTSSLLAEYPRMQALKRHGRTLERGIYIVDPIGNLVFRYPMADAGAPVLKDLKRLLKLSQIG
jgi:cytochrome oxidase Cu insertion factor (SCO1/SenC/PrrC family)